MAAVSVDDGTGVVDDSDDELPVTRQRRTARRQRLAAIEAATELRNASRRREHIKRQVRARGGRAAAEAEDWEDEGGSDEGGELSGEEEGESEAWLTEVREPAELIDELMQSLVLLFERGAAKGSELARSGPSLQFIDESLSIPQAVIRVLGACAALGGDRDVGDLLSTRAMEQAKELLEASAENEPLVCAELCEAWLPPLLSPQCSPWARIAYLRVLTDLAAWSPLVDLRLEPLLSTFVAWLGYHRDGDGEDEDCACAGDARAHAVARHARQPTPGLPEPQEARQPGRAALMVRRRRDGERAPPRARDPRDRRLP